MSGFVENPFEAARPWPVVPPPQPDESLSSWLGRIGREYGLTGEELLQPVGSEKFEAGADLDGDPPDALVGWLSYSTGQAPDHIRAMTLSGYVPTLLDGLTPQTGTLTGYVSRIRLISRLDEPVAGLEITPWIDHRWGAAWGCTACLEEDTFPYRRLHWRLPWMLTCPTHECFLRRVLVEAGHGWLLIDSPFDRVPLEAELVHLGRATGQAVTLGHVNMPGGRIPGGVWVRLLRAAIEEVARFPPDTTPRGTGIAELWDDLGIRSLGTEARACPYEALPPKIKLRLLRVTALAMERARSLLTGWMEGNGPAVLDREVDALRRGRPAPARAPCRVVP
jgi:hypothetical protein